MCYACTDAGFGVALCAHYCMGKDKVDNLQIYLTWWFLGTLLSLILSHNSQRNARVKTVVRSAAARIAQTPARVNSAVANVLAKIAAHLAREKTVGLRNVVKAGRSTPAHMERHQRTEHFAWMMELMRRRAFLAKSHQTSA